MTGLVLLGWIVGLTFLGFCWHVASVMASPMTPTDEWCAAVDAELEQEGK